MRILDSILLNLDDSMEPRLRTKTILIMDSSELTSNPINIY